MDKLKELLDDDELYEKLVEKLNGKEIIIKDENFAKNWVPKTRFNEEIDKVKSARSEKVQLMSEVEEKDEKIANLEREIEKLKESAPDVKGLEEKIKALEAEKTDLEKDIENTKKIFEKKSRIRKALFLEKANPQYLDYLEAKVEVDWDEEGKELVGLNEILPRLKEEYPVMFGEVKAVGITPKPGDGHPDEEYFTLEEIKNMDVDTVSKNLEKVNASIAYHHGKKN